MATATAADVRRRAPPPAVGEIGLPDAGTGFNVTCGKSAFVHLNMKSSNWISLLAPVGAAVITGLAASPTALATPAGLFEGYFAVTDANNPAGSYQPGHLPVGGTLGGWTATITQGARINTFDAPNSIFLSADSSPTITTGRGSNLSPLEGPAGSLARLTILAPSAGTFSFDVGLEVGNLAFILGSQTSQLMGGGGFSFNIAAGQVFGFEVLSDFGSTAHAPLVSPRGVAQPAAPGPQGVGISNPVFIGVPESSTWVAGLAVSGLIGSAFCRRTQRR